MSSVAGATAPPRVRLLAFSPPTTGRFLMLIAALIGTGLFVGDWLHTQVAGADYVDAVRACGIEPDGAGGRAWPGDTCRADVERVRAVYMACGAAAVGMGGLIVLFTMPTVIRRKRRLRPLGPGLAPVGRRFAELARESGIRRCPALVVGPPSQRDAFCFGAPGRYTVALPKGVVVRWRKAELFDPVVRHELAHLRHHDVAFAWLATSVWYVLAPALTLPLVVALFTGDGSLVPDYLWRATLLACTVQLVSVALIRSREFDADLRAAGRPAGPEALAALVANVRPPARHGYRRLLSAHPEPAERLAVLTEPALAARVTFVDGFATAFLAALTVPLGVALVISATVGSGPQSMALLVLAVLVGPLMGGSVGLALWRSAVVRRVPGHASRPWPAALGVAVGLVAGRVATLEQTGSGVLDSIAAPAGLLVIACAATGCTLVAAAVGEVWADATPALPRAGMSWVAVLVTGLMYAVLFWAAQEFDLLLRADGWSLVADGLVAMPDRWLAVLAVVVMFACVAVALAVRRSGAATPAWLLERGPQAIWPVDPTSRAAVATTGLAAGAAGATIIVGFILITGTPDSAEYLFQRYIAYIWLAAAVGAASDLVIGVLRPGHGLGYGAVTGPLAGATAMAGFLVLNVLVGADLTVSFIADSVLPALVICLLLVMVVAPGTLLLRIGRPVVRRVWTVSVPAALLVGLCVLAVTGVITPPTEPGVGRSAEFARTAAAKDYLDATAPDIARRYTAIESAVTAINDDRAADGRTRAQRIRTEVLPPVDAMLAEAERYRARSPQVEAVHALAVTAIRVTKETFTMFVAAYERNDARLFDAAQGKRDDELRSWQAWLTAVAELRGR